MNTWRSSIVVSPSPGSDSRIAGPPVVKSNAAGVTASPA